MTFLGLEIGSWADWASAVGTISAVVLTLVIQHNSGKIKLNVGAGNGMIEGKWTHYTVSVTNTGSKVVTITAAGFLLPSGKAFLFVENTYPIRLEPGDDSLFVAEVQIVKQAAVELKLVGQKVQSYVKDTTGHMYKGKKFII
ncbi:hypothetical protein J8137_09990 [Lactiplantibacillus plantarum]|nr:hypothetical protein [Lactiplantibacillus plantarum]